MKLLEISFLLSILQMQQKYKTNYRRWYFCFEWQENYRKIIVIKEMTYHNKILMFFTFYFCRVKSLLRNNLIAMLFPYMVLMIHCCPVKTTPSWSNTWSLYISFFRSRPDEEKAIYKFKCGLKSSQNILLYSAPPHPDHSMQRLNIQSNNQS